jgi:hypothetical protein
MPFCSLHRTPRAGVDPIRDEAAALSVVRLAMQHPASPETIAVMLDHERRGVSLVVVRGTHHPDDVVDVADRLSALAAGGDRIGGFVLASIRPGGGLDPGDADRWLEMSDGCEQLGLELVEWFVIAATVACPRDLLGERPRW